VLAGKIFLVTGATGRLGSALTARLEELGASVLPLVLNGYPSRPHSVSWTARTLPLVITNATGLTGLPSPDAVINLHWKVDRTRTDTEQLLHELDLNVHQPGFLWDWLKSREPTRFINVSSINIFSHLNQGPVNARTEPRPASPYGIAKFAAEKFFDARFSGGRTSVTHLRLCSVCSYGEHPSQLVSRLAASTFQRKSFTLHTGHRVSLMYIDEAIDTLINAALTAISGPHLAVTPSQTVEEVASLFQSLSGLPLHVERRDLTPNIQEIEYASDLDRLRAPWVRVTPLAQALTLIMKQWPSSVH